MSGAPPPPQYRYVRGAAGSSKLCGSLAARPLPHTSGAGAASAKGPPGAALVATPMQKSVQAPPASRRVAAE